MLQNKYIHILYVAFVSFTLIATVLQDEKNVIRPFSYLILSFFVFVWMRYILNLLFGTEVISIGQGITDANVNLVAIYLGWAMNLICVTCLIVEGTLTHIDGVFIKSHRRLVIPRWAETMLVVLALCFFAMFLLDSVRKITVINSRDYLAVSETIMVQGYRLFSMGKYLIILWILFGTHKDRFFWGSTILMVSGVGYLMRGARGYAIMYIFMWLMFFSFRHKIKLVWLFTLGLALIYLANFILSYRLGWSVASGFKNILISTLNSQGASIEPVFGSVIFKKEISKYFEIYELFTRYDFGIIVDRVRGTGFTMGGFGSSFFAEAFFMGIPLGIIMMMVAGGCAGALEYAYKLVKKSNGRMEYAQMLLFMTIPNLIYLGRSSVKDFVIKTVVTIVILGLLQSVSRRSFVTNELYSGENEVL
jgi:hypothetical protein